MNLGKTVVTNSLILRVKCSFVSPAKAPTKIRRPKYPQRSCSSDTHPKICQLILSVLMINVFHRMGAISTAHALASHPAVMRDFCRRTLYLFQSNSALTISFGISVHEVETLILMAIPPGSSGFQYLSKFKLASSWGSLPWRSMPTDLLLWLVMIEDLLLFSRLWTLFTPSSRVQHAPSAAVECAWFHHLLQRNQSWISNIHPWRFWRCWSTYTCSTRFFAWALGIVSPLFESCCWKEYIGTWSDGFR